MPQRRAVTWVVALLVVALAAPGGWAGPPSAAAPPPAEPSPADAPSAALPSAASAVESGLEAVRMGPPEPPRAEPLVRRRMTLEKVFRALWYDGRRADYEPTTPGERRAFRRLVPGLLMAAADPAADPAADLSPWQELAHRAGFRIQIWDVEGRVYWALVEDRHRARGAGAYVFRPGPPAADGREVVLQAPHPYFDRHTGVLAARLFFSPPGDVAPRALFTSTVQRYRGRSPDGPRDGSGRPAASETDVCHNPRHLFLVVSDAAAHTLGRAVFVQIHGFADSSVSLGPDALPVRAVVSAGERRGSTDTSAAVAWALVDALGPGVLRFPEDVRRLGGTRNVIGRQLRRYPAVDFVHLELAFSVRRQLRDDGLLLADVGRALLAAAARPSLDWEAPAPPSAPAPVHLPPSQPSPGRASELASTVPPATAAAEPRTGPGSAAGVGDPPGE